MFPKKEEKPKEDTDDFDSDNFIEEFWKRQLEIDRRWEERVIEADRIKHRFDKLKAPEPRWIHG